MRRLVFVSLCLAALLPTFSSSAAPLGSRELDAVPLHMLSPVDLERVRAALPEPPPHGPVRLAITVPMPLGLGDGAWSQDGDTAVWRMRVYSAEATLLIAEFDRFELPQGAELRFSDVAGSVVQGPYTRRDRSSDGGLWTALVPGNEALVEIRTPAATRDDVDIHVATFSHGLRSDRVSPKSGGCNIDVACAAGSGWEGPIRSAVLLTIPLSGATVSLCSGQLINNSAQDDRGFILTANHCGITTSNDQGVTVYFNYETRPCGGSPNGTLSQNLIGTVLRASHSRSDHTLIELEDRIPGSFNAFFSGYDARGSITQSGRAIHHPQGGVDDGRVYDEKRISVYESAPSQVNGQQIGTTPDDSFIVDAYRVTWSQGTTEAGSSGGGLWNSNRHVIGVLSGGEASCSNRGGTDYFGRLETAWAGEPRFRQFLDPTRTDGVVPGKDAGATASDDPTFVDDDDGGGGGGAFGGALLLLAVALARRIRFSARS